VIIERDDVEIVSEDIPGWTVANEGNLTVALDLEVTETLRLEGLAREVVKKIQNYRKDSGFEITDHVNVLMENNPDLEASVQMFNEYICGQVLAERLEFCSSVPNATIFDFDVIVHLCVKCASKGINK
jgi:isoleucyl-tRNA synthetase